METTSVPLHIALISTEEEKKARVAYTARANAGFDEARKKCEAVEAKVKRMQELVAAMENALSDVGNPGRHQHYERYHEEYMALKNSTDAPPSGPMPASLVLTAGDPSPKDLAQIAQQSALFARRELKSVAKSKTMHPQGADKEWPGKPIQRTSMVLDKDTDPKNLAFLLKTQDEHDVFEKIRDEHIKTGKSILDTAVGTVFFDDPEMWKGHVVDYTRIFIETLYRLMIDAGGVDTYRRLYEKSLEEIQRIALYKQRTPEWLESRDYIVTASLVPAIMGIKGSYLTRSNAFSIVCKTGDHKAYQTEYMQNGITAEANVIKQLRTRGMEIKDDYGLLIHEEYGFLGGSPDGVITMKDGSKVLLEIKAPVNIGNNWDRLVPLPWYYQIQTLLGIMGLKKALLVRTPNMELGTGKLYETDVEFNKELFYNRILPEVAAFIFQEVVPFLKTPFPLRHFPTSEKKAKA